MAKAVKTGVVIVGYTIYDYEVDGEVKFDWTASNGAESPELFDSAEEAEQEAIRTLGG